MNMADYPYPDNFDDLVSQVDGLMARMPSGLQRNYRKQIDADTGTLGYMVPGFPGSQVIIQARIVRDASLEGQPFWGKWSVSAVGGDTEFASHWFLYPLAVTLITFPEGWA